MAPESVLKFADCGERHDIGKGVGGGERGAGGGVRAQGGGSGRCRGPTRPQPKPPACMARTPHAPSRSRAAVAGTAIVVSAAQPRTRR